MQLYRSMRDNVRGKPVCEQSARGLGVRVPDDIAVDDHGDVHPFTEGMSIAPEHPRNLQRHRRPAEFKGTGKDPVFSTKNDTLGERLNFRADPDRPTAHGFIEPSITMTLDAYRKALCGTSDRWRKVHANDFSGT